MIDFLNKKRKQLASGPILERFVRKVDYRKVSRPELGRSKHQSNYPVLLKDAVFENYLAERLSHTRDAIFELLIVKK